MENLPIKPRKKGFFSTLFSFFKKPTNDYTTTKHKEVFRDFYNTTSSINTEEEFYEYLDKVKSGEYRTSSILSNISPSSHLMTKKRIILDALEICGLDLQYVVGILKKDSLVLLTAVESNGFAIKYIDINIQTTKIIENALTKTPLALEYVKEDYKSNPENRSFLLKTIKRQAYSLEYLPNYQDDIEFMNAAVGQNPMSIKFAGKKIPNDLIIASVEEINKKIIEKGKEFVKQGNNPLEFEGFYHNLNMQLFYTIKDIKDRDPDRFKNIEFITKLCNIYPGFLKLADEELFKNEDFAKKYGNFLPKTMTYSEFITSIEDNNEDGER